jgi:hypothetical protein
MKLHSSICALSCRSFSISPLYLPTRTQLQSRSSHPTEDKKYKNDLRHNTFTSNSLHVNNNNNSLKSSRPLFIIPCLLEILDRSPGEKTLGTKTLGTKNLGPHNLHFKDFADMFFLLLCEVLQRTHWCPLPLADLSMIYPLCYFVLLDLLFQQLAFP